ncbi:MAG: hypothetical protein NVSMB32_14760 [Actinomycetota bacterium]
MGVVGSGVEGSRGRLLVYVGAAPAVGKTVAMLKEGRRRAQEGSDVVVGLVETRDRPRTRAALAGLELIPPLQPSYRGLIGRELDVDAILARRPQLCLVDELAHTNLPGAGRGNDKRWQDVEILRWAGVDVISTLNIQHLASLVGEVERITGVRQRQTLPDEVLAAADIRLIDMDSAALRRRLLSLQPPAAGRAGGQHFRLASLEALRQLTLAWVDAWAAREVRPGPIPGHPSTALPKAGKNI